MTDQPRNVPEHSPAPAAGVIDVFELKERYERGERPLVIDVREAEELSICRLPHTTHLPLSGFEAGWRTLLDGRMEEEIILMCRSGKRSAQAQQYLAHFGYRRVRNLTGGILAWADGVDPTLRRY